MLLISLPIILYILPVIIIITLVVPPKQKRLDLSLGGLVYIGMTGGFQALILFLLMLVSSWMILRLQPSASGENNTRSLGWMYAGIGLQFLWLMLGKLLLSGAQLIPLILCAMQNTECICARAGHRIPIPALFQYFCYSTEAPRLLAGPPMHPDAVDTMWKKQTADEKNIGSGAALLIRGIFQNACLSLPMMHLHSELSELVHEKTIFDTLLLISVFYLALYFSYKGAAQMGQGIVMMIGLKYPESAEPPVFAGTFREFWTRLLNPFTQWTQRVFHPEKAADSASYFARAVLVFGGVGLLLGNSIGGLLWGVSCALLLTAERMLNPKWIQQIPLAARRLVIAFLVLFCLGMLRSSSLSDLFGFYGDLFGRNGLTISGTTLYFIRNNWFTLLFCLAALFPVRRTILSHSQKTSFRRFVFMIFAFCADMLMLTMSMAELMSHYLRN